MSEIYGQIREALRALRESPRPLEVFGSQEHEFQTHPPLSEAFIRKFEEAHRIVLPAEYRGFLLEVGNGGAGPGYGLFKFGEMDENNSYGPWHEGDGFVGVLSEPFPHTSPWNDLSEEPEQDEERDSDEDPEWEERYASWEEGYWDPANANGAIPICHLGCAYRQWLVVTGPEAGNIWCDDRTDNAGLYPLEEGGLPRVTFLQWYRSWLDEALEQLRGERPA
jgi:SMI1/KNR4 family protein SUKH-1